MANLTAVFELIDRMSDKMDAISSRGEAAVGNWEHIGESADQAFDKAASAADGVASAMDSYNKSAQDAAAQTDYWTDAVGNYDKSALEAIYSTQELVDMGMKSADALEHEADIMAECDRAAQELSDALDASTSAQEELSSAMDEANRVAEEIADNDKVAAETKEALQKATEDAAQAFEELEQAQAEAQSAMDNYNSVMESGTARLDEMEDAARQAAEASEKLEKAQENATDAAEDLADATEDASKEAEKAGKKGDDAIKTLQSALASAGILKAVEEITGALLDAADAAAQAETAFAKLQTIAGADSMGMLTDQIRELSAETGIAQDALADVAYNAISAGAAVEEAVGTAGAASKLAAAGFTDTSSALSVLSTAMNSYGDAAGTAEDISNSLIMVQNLGVTTVAELSASMGKSISTAAAYNVSLGNLESAYVSVTKAGINTAEATTYISGMLSELGKEGSNVATILQEETGQSFGQLMSSGYSLADVLQIIYDAAGNDAEAMMNLWGSQTAGVASAAIVNQGLEQFNTNLVAIEQSAGATESAYSVMANTTQHAQEKMQNSAENLKIAVGDSLNPALEKLYNLGGSAFQWAADFAEEHPIVVKAITAVAVGIGAVAVAIGGFVFITQVAIPALSAFGVALNTALGPIGWVAIAITGVVAAGTALVAMLSDSEDENSTWTKKTQQQYDALQDLNAEYDEAVDKYGDTSEEALRLQYKIEDLSAEFEAQKRTVEEFQNEVDELCSSVDELWQNFDDATSEINTNKLGTLALIQKYEDLAEKTELTVAEQKQMEAISASLAEKFPELADSLDDVTYSTEQYVAAMKKAAEDDAAAQLEQKVNEAYTSALAERERLQMELEKAKENLKAEEDWFYSEDWAWWSDQNIYKLTGLDPFNTNNIDEYKKVVEQIQAEIKKNENGIKELERNYEYLADREKKAAEEATSYEEAVRVAIGSVQTEMDELVKAYDEAFDAARNSISSTVGLFNDMSMSGLENNVKGNFGVFDELEVKAEKSAGKLVDILEGQTEQLTEYADNLKSAASYGLDEGLLEMLSDGSTDSMANLSTIVEEIERLGRRTDEARQYVDDLNTAFAESQAAQDYFTRAQTTADDLLASLQSQNDFITQYVENIQRATEIGLNENLLASLSDGSEESAAQLQAIIDKVDELGGERSQSARTFIAEINGAFKDVETAKDTFAGTVATMETDFDEKMTAIEKRMDTAIDNLTMEDDAAKAAHDTIQAYVDAIRDGVGDAESAALAVANAASKALSSTYTGSSSTATVPGHAAGTTNAEDVFIAGEEGPELIIGAGGSTVFPNEETERILDAVSNEDRDRNIETMTVMFSPLLGMWGNDGSVTTSEAVTSDGSEDNGGIFFPVSQPDGGDSDRDGGGGDNTRKVLLEIAGKGNIELRGGKVDDEAMLQFLYEYLKPVLSEILTQEIYEEGDGSYEY